MQDNKMFPAYNLGSSSCVFFSVMLVPCRVPQALHDFRYSTVLSIVVTIFLLIIQRARRHHVSRKFALRRPRHHESLSIP